MTITTNDYYFGGIKKKRNSGSVLIIRRVVFYKIMKSGSIDHVFCFHSLFCCGDDDGRWRWGVREGLFDWSVFKVPPAIFVPNLWIKHLLYSNLRSWQIFRDIFKIMQKFLNFLKFWMGLRGLKNNAGFVLEGRWRKILIVV